MNTKQIVRKFKCTKDWSSIDADTFEGNICILKREYFRNGETQLKLMTNMGHIFESPAVFWTEIFPNSK